MGVVASCFPRESASDEGEDDEETSLVSDNKTMCRWKSMPIRSMKRRVVAFPIATRRGLVVASSDNRVLRCVPVPELRAIVGRVAGNRGRKGNIVPFVDLGYTGDIDQMLASLPASVVHEVKCNLTDDQVNDVLSEMDEVGLRDVVEMAITELAIKGQDVVFSFSDGSSSDDGEEGQNTKGTWSTECA